MKKFAEEFTRASRDIRDEVTQFNREHPAVLKAVKRGLAAGFLAAVVLGVGNGVYRMDKNPVEYTQYATAHSKMQYGITPTPPEAAAYAKVEEEQKPFIQLAVFLTLLTGAGAAGTAIRRTKPERLSNRL
jgi:hypothetical protein